MFYILKMPYFIFKYKSQCKKVLRKHQIHIEDM